MRSEPVDDSQWWTVFNDAILTDLVQVAYQQNLTVREAGFRVLQARAELGVATGKLFPQTQTFNADFNRTEARRQSRTGLPRRKSRSASGTRGSICRGSWIFGADFAALWTRPRIV